MRHLIIATVLVMAGVASEAASNLCSSLSIQDWRPWPWGSEISVPWKNISGVWESSDGSCENLFLFRVKVDQNGDKLVVITQYDPNSCKVVAQGLGYEADRYIYAQMVHHGQSYNLTIHAFNESDLSSTTKAAKRSLRSDEPSGKVVLALTLSPVGRWDDRSAYQITKVSNSSSMVCDKQ